MKGYLFCSGGPKRLAGALLTFGLLLGGAAQAQLLPDVLTAAAISAELNPAVHLPSGSLRVLGEVPPSLLAKVPGAANYTDWEAYTATGLGATLQPAFIHDLSTSFAVAGYFLANETETQRGAETHTRYLFSNDAGEETLLYVIRTPQELVWLIAKSL